MTPNKLAAEIHKCLKGLKVRISDTNTLANWRDTYNSVDAKQGPLAITIENWFYACHEVHEMDVHSEKDIYEVYTRPCMMTITRGVERQIHATGAAAMIDTDALSLKLGEVEDTYPLGHADLIEIDDPTGQLNIDVLIAIDKVKYGIIEKVYLQPGRQKILLDRPLVKEIKVGTAIQGGVDISHVKYNPKGLTVVCPGLNVQNDKFQEADMSVEIGNKNGVCLTYRHKTLTETSELRLYDLLVGVHVDAKTCRKV